MHRLETGLSTSKHASPQSSARAMLKIEACYLSLDMEICLGLEWKGRSRAWDLNFEPSPRNEMWLATGLQGDGGGGKDEMKVLQISNVISELTS